MATIFEVSTTSVAVLLAITGVLAFISSLQLLSQSFELKTARKVFMQINLAFLVTIILVTVDQYLKFNL